MNKDIVVKSAVVGLLLVFALLVFSSIFPAKKSPTCDELAHHVPVAYILLTKWDFKMDPSQPPLARYIMAIPLKLFLNLHVPEKKSDWRREDRSEYGHDFFYVYNSDPDKIILLARTAMICVGIFTAFLVFYAARRFYGNAAALFSLFLFVFCPNMIANAQLATIDMTASCFILLSVVMFCEFADNHSRINIILAGVALGLAQLSKYTSIFLYPFFLLMIIPRAYSDKGTKKILIRTMYVFAISVMIVWAGYGFNSDPILSDSMRIDEKLSLVHNMVQKIPFWQTAWDPALDNMFLKWPFPLGAHVMWILGVARHGYEGHSVYFMGEWGKGSPFYFLIAFLIKTPVPSIIFILLGICLTFFKMRPAWRDKFLLATVLVIFLMASFSKLQLGLRYILPMYPIFFILAGRSVEAFRWKYFKPIGIVLAVWYIFSAVNTWPNYLSYFNEFIGGPANGYKYLRDSNLDWGQDLPELSAYLKKNKIENIKLLYFGTADPDRYGIKYEPLDAKEYLSPAESIYAISVHKLDTVKWTKDKEPIAKIGYSIFVYDCRSR